MNADPLPLSSPRWKQLQQAYGSAEGIPNLLMKIGAAGTKDESDWFDLWSSICHQDTVYSSTLVVIPHLAEMMSHGQNSRLNLEFIHIIAYSHLCAAESGVGPDQDFRGAYDHAIKKCLGVAIETLALPWATVELRALVASILSMKGDLKLRRLLFKCEASELDHLLEVVENLELPSKNK
jgi:hypothetical protein